MTTIKNKYKSLVKRWGKVPVSLTLALVLVLMLAAAALAASVEPSVIPGAENPGKNCSDVFPGTLEIKFDPAASGSKTVGGQTVTIVTPSTLAGSLNSIDFTATWPVLGVIVKDGVDGANVYDYSADPQMADTYLTTPFEGDKGISHISFCYLEPEFEPDIMIEKTGDLLSKIGDFVDYIITVTNTSSEGTPDLYCHITDPLVGVDEFKTLAWNASPYVIDVFDFEIPEDADDPFINTAEVSCTYVGDTVVQATDSDTHEVNLFQPEIELMKTGDELSKIGDLVDYTITLHNHSSWDTPDMYCTITDEMLDIDVSFWFAWDALPYVVNVPDFEIPEDADDPFVNIAEVECVFADFPNVLEDEASWEVDLFQPSYEFMKEAEQEYSKAGDYVDYTITLTNTSSEDTPDLYCTITDVMLGIDDSFWIAWDDEPYVIEESYLVLPGDVSPLINTAEVTCSPDGFPNELDDEASAEVTLIFPAFALTKTCMTEPVIPGAYATFEVEFENLGDVPLVVEFDEDLVGIGCPMAGVEVTVDVGESLVCTIDVLADTDPAPSVVSNEINAHVTLPAMYGLDNYWDPYASDTCDIYGVKSGYKFNDLNNNGVWDLGEPELAGWDIHFIKLSDSSMTPVTTDVNGKYTFNMVWPGVDYAVCEVLKAGFTQTYPVALGAGLIDCTQFGAGYGPIGYLINLASGEYEFDNNFGNYKAPGCTYTQGYWKTHSTYGPASPYDPTWDLKAGGDAKFLSDAWHVGFTWYSMFWTPPAGGNAYIILAHQYMAAWLSINNVDPLKAADPTVLGAALADAEALLGAYTPEDILTSEVREQFIALASFLDMYNNGELPGGPPHCD
jgi:hypothetical protein